MDVAELITATDALVDAMVKADWKGREAIKDELLALVEANPLADLVQHLEECRKRVSLEVRWEIDEVLEAVAEPEPEPESEPEPEEDATYDPNAQVTMADLTPIYEDPRGLAVFKHRLADRYFASEVNPQTGQTQMFELHPQQFEQLKTQLAGSPFWILGSGAASAR